jgi:hypothetical protein
MKRKPQKGAKHALLIGHGLEAPQITLECQPNPDGKTMSFACPWCPPDRKGNQPRHTHGLGDGHRVSHCHAPDAPGEYRVKIAVEIPNESP